MKKQLKYLALISAIAGAAAIAVNAHAQGFGGHAMHHRQSALGVCLAAAPESVKTNLRSTFQNSSLHNDMISVKSARQALTEQILAKNTNLTSYETALSQAQLKVLQDRDAIAQSVCGQLSSSQLAAASTLYTNLQNNQDTVSGYFQAAHQASEQ